MSKIEKELTEVTKVTRNEGEDDQAYLTRVSAKANALSDDDWAKLSEPVQRWVNAAQRAKEEKTALPTFDGELPAPTPETAPAAKTKAEKRAEKAAASKEAPAAKTPAAKPAKAATTKPAAKPAKAAPAAKKPAAAPKTAAKAAANSGDGRGRPSRYPMNATVEKLVAENPHRKGTKSFDYYKVYKDGMTLKQVLDKGVPRAEVNWHVDRGIVKFNTPKA